jgi:cytochrome c-type biogenesis protein CcmF
MTPALGRGLILLSLLAAAAGALVAFVTAGRAPEAARAWTRRFAYLYALALLAANLVMVVALLRPDFSVAYVTHVGSRSVPKWVAVVSLWSSLEGSILFWGGVLALYIAAAAFATRHRHPEHMPWATGVWLACASFFSFLLAGPAQPFGTVVPPPLDGPGPNPLLQNHVLMAIHPPFLYAGYVGMTIPFGLAAAALLARRLGPDFQRTLRTWLLLPWTFLTIAIVLGGWWAYEVLGWGGYWAWDPVENASFLPWLTATAALHSALLVERKGALKGWTMTLVMGTFLLTILGTFMTRSGVFNSVHSFTQSAIGPTILVFLAAATLFTIVLLALRIDTLATDTALAGGASRETLFLVNNLVFVLFTFTVLIGTVFPLVVEATRGVQMSVGRPYFDRMAVPLGAAIVFLMGVGPALPWGRATAEQARRTLLWPLIGGVVLLAIGWAGGAWNVWTLLTLFLAGYALQVTSGELTLPARQRMRTRGEGLGSALLGSFGQGRRRVAGYVIHAAAVVLIVAVAVSGTMGVSKEQQLVRGQSLEIGRYTLTLLGVDVVPEAQREAIVARVAVTSRGRDLGLLRPAMKQYSAERDPIGTPAVRSGLFEDLYLSVMNIDANQQTLGLHALVNPLVSWIWYAMIVMALGGFVAAWPARRPPEGRQ